MQTANNITPSRIISGTLLRGPTPKRSIPDRPYLIGLTGGIASGKSNIAAELRRLGAGVVDCDKVAHRAYAPGSQCFQQIVDKFGPLADGGNIVRDDGLIDRQKLGAIVFGNPALRKELEGIVWPATRTLTDAEIDKLKQDKRVIVVEAALLLEANWQERLHEVWVTIIPEAEAIERLKVRNNLSEEEAKKRIASQMSNSDRVQQANVVFCSLWDYEFTRQQVEKAWTMLNERLL